MASFQLAQLHSECEPTIIKVSVHLLMVIVKGPSIIAMYKFYNCPYLIVIIFILKNTNLKTLLLCYAQLRVDKKPIKSRCGHSHSHDINVCG